MSLDIQGVQIMKSQGISRQVKLLAGITAAALLYQNCTPHTLVIDEDFKTKTLSSKNILTGSPLSEDRKIAGFTFVCPREEVAKPVDLLHSEELKAVVEKFDFETGETSVLCEIHGIKKQILDTRSVDLSDCGEVPSAQNSHMGLYIVPEEIHSNYDQHKINIDTTPLSLGGYSLNYLAMDKDAKEAACDEAGAPLMIQLSSTATALSLTAPTDGVEINLLGNKSYRSPHDKVLASWLTPNSAGDVFVVVKPNSEKLILGADEIFADTTRGPDTKYAKQGFAALEKFDNNKDLLISSDDVIFQELRLWKDSNHDGQAQESELSTLKEQKILAIDLRFVSHFSESDTYGNQSRNKSVVVMEDGTYGIAFDLWLRFIHRISESSTPSTPSPAHDSQTIPTSEPQDTEGSEDPSSEEKAARVQEFSVSQELTLPSDLKPSDLEEVK